jgi:outer membrane protein assembly factor BamB
VLAVWCAGCGALAEVGGPAWVSGVSERTGRDSRSVSVRWRQQIAPDYQGAYIPVERASVAVDPARDRVYVGSSAGQLWALSSLGARIYRYDAGGSIFAAPALDAARDELFVATEDGVLHMLSASTGVLRWRVEVGAAVSQPPALVGDAVYVVTDGDALMAVSRERGEVLWRVRRSPPDGFSISGHAGLAVAGTTLITAFTSGVVAAFDAGDGSLLWERDTSVELESAAGDAPRFVDVDTTPVVIDDTVYVASFAGGLYGLELRSGTVRFRDESLTGITAIEPAGERQLLLSSADDGLLCVDREQRTVVWRKTLPRGAPGDAVVVGDVVLFGESQGGFVTLSLRSGQELGRVETGHGFSARAAVADGRGFVLSNGGTLYAFALAPTP